MFSKKYIKFKQTLDNFAKKGALSGIQDGDGLIRDIVLKYSTVYKPKNNTINLFFKYLITLSIISSTFYYVYLVINLPTYIWIKSHITTCTFDQENYPKAQLPECKNSIGYPQKEDDSYLEKQNQTWNFYTKILYFILLISYIPYTIYSYYVKIRGEDISIFYGIRQIIYSLLLVGLIAFTWNIGVGIGVLYNMLDIYYYYTFGTLTIP